MGPAEEHLMWKLVSTSFHILARMSQENIEEYRTAIEEARGGMPRNTSDAPDAMMRANNYMQQLDWIHLGSD